MVRCPSWRASMFLLGVLVVVISVILEIFHFVRDLEVFFEAYLRVSENKGTRPARIPAYRIRSKVQTMFFLINKWIKSKDRNRRKRGKIDDMGWKLKKRGKIQYSSTTAGLFAKVVEKPAELRSTFRFPSNMRQTQICAHIY
jgi:hypothetical protein